MRKVLQLIETSDSCRLVSAVVNVRVKEEGKNSIRLQFQIGKSKELTKFVLQ